jgi:hypothetical protein
MLQTTRGPWPQVHPLFALALSLAVHAALGYAVGTSSGTREDNRMLDAEAVSVLHVALQSSRAATPAASAPQPPAHHHEAGAMQASALSRPAAAKYVGDSAPMVDVELQRADRYYKLSELTQRPFILRDVPQTLPADLPAVQPQTAVIQLLINEVGAIDKVTFDESNLPGEVERFLADSFSRASFYPGKIHDVAVKSRMRIEIRLEKAAQ